MVGFSMVHSPSHAINYGKQSEEQCHFTPPLMKLCVQVISGDAELNLHFHTF